MARNALVFLKNVVGIWFIGYTILIAVTDLVYPVKGMHFDFSPAIAFVVFLGYLFLFVIVRVIDVRSGMKRPETIIEKIIVRVAVGIFLLVFIGAMILSSKWAHDITQKINPDPYMVK